MNNQPKWYLYFLQCENDTHDADISQYPETRIKDHICSKGGKFTKANKPIKTIGIIDIGPGNANALKLERYFKTRGTL